MPALATKVLEAVDPNTVRFGDDGGYQTVGDVFSNGLIVFVLGLLTVFAVLAIIWAVLEVFHVFAYKLPEKRRANKSAAAVTEPTAVTAAPEQTSDDGEIVAVIAAAIAAAQAESPKGEFRVVSFRKK